jgi:hypothetical protein
MILGWTLKRSDRWYAGGIGWLNYCSEHLKLGHLNE